MANLRTNNLSGEQGQNAYRGSVFFSGDNDFLDISSSEIAAAIPGGDEPYTIEMWVQFGRGGTDTDSGGSDSLIAYGTNSTRSYNGIDWTGTAIRNVWYSDDLSYTVDDTSFLTDGSLPLVDDSGNYYINNSSLMSSELNYVQGSNTIISILPTTSHDDDNDMKEIVAGVLGVSAELIEIDHLENKNPLAANLVTQVDSIMNIVGSVNTSTDVSNEDKFEQAGASMGQLMHDIDKPITLEDLTNPDKN